MNDMTTQEIVNLPALVPSVSESTLGQYDKSKMDKEVLSWVSDVRGSELKFLSVVQFALGQFAKKNNMPLTAIACIVNGKEFSGFKLAGAKGETLKQFKEPLKAILDKCLVGSTLTFKDGKAKWKVTSNGGVNHEGLETLKALVQEGVSYKGAKFREAFPKQKSERALLNEATKNLVESLLEKPQDKLTEAEQKVVEKAKEAEEAARVKAVKAFVAKCQEAGWSLDEIIGMMKSKDI
jgi:hypothetical protein